MVKTIVLSDGYLSSNLSEEQIIVVRGAAQLHYKSKTQVGDKVCYLDNFLVKCYEVTAIEDSHAVCKPVADVMVLNCVKSEELAWDVPLYVSLKKQMSEVI